MAKDNLPKPIINKTMGKRERLKITDKKGKKHKATFRQTTESDVEDKTLIKIAPMYWFSKESHKVIMIPFSIKMSAEEFMKQTAKQAVNFDEILNKVNKEASDELKSELN